MYDAARFASLGTHELIPWQPPREIDRRCLASIIARSVGRNLRAERSDGAPESGGIPKFFQRGAAAE